MGANPSKYSGEDNPYDTDVNFPPDQKNLEQSNQPSQKENIIQKKEEVVKKKLTQNDWDSLYNHTKNTLSDKFLSLNLNISAVRATGIDFSRKDKNFDRLNIICKNSEISHCRFDSLVAGENTSFAKSCIDKTDFSEIYFGHGTFNFTNCTFLDVNFIKIRAYGNIDVCLDFNGSFLKNVNFTGAYDLAFSFIAAILAQCNFTVYRDKEHHNDGTNSFKKAKLIDVIFDGSKWYFPDFENAEMQRTCFGVYQNKYCKIKRGNFKNTDLRGCYLSGTYFDCHFDSTKLDQAYLINVHGISLSTLLTAEFETLYVDKNTLINMGFDKDLLSQTCPNCSFFTLSRIDKALTLHPIETASFIKKVTGAYPSAKEYPEIKEHPLLGLRLQKHSLFQPVLSEKSKIDIIIGDISVTLQSSVKAINKDVEKSVVTSEIVFNFK